MNTVIYVFNENGIFNQSGLEEFCLNFENKTSLDFIAHNKTDTVSTVYKLFSKKNLDYIVYDHGYVMKIDGEIKETIFLLKELDEIIESKTSYFLSPVQRISNSDNCKFPRKSSIKGIAQFLDKLFDNNEYTQALNELA